MLTRETIVEAFDRLSHELGSRGVLGEINIVAGMVMVLAFEARSSTKDVDAIFEPTAYVREAAATVAGALSLPLGWLNDAVKGVASFDYPHLRIQAPTPEYMLAMKVMAACTGALEGSGDKSDIAFLISLLALPDAGAVMEIVQRYYDPSRVLPRSMYLVDEVFEELHP